MASIGPFFDEVAKQLHAYMRTHTFRTRILQDIKKFPKNKIKKEIDSRIANATLQWQTHNLEDIFQEKILENLTQRCSSITSDLNSIKDNMMGLKTSQSSNDIMINSIVTVGPAVLGLLKTGINPGMFYVVVLTAAGLAGGMLLKESGIFGDLDTFINQAFEERVHAHDESKIKELLHARHAESILSEIRRLFDVDFTNKIENLKENLRKMKDEQALYISEQNTLQLLGHILSKNIANLDNLECLLTAQTEGNLTLIS